MKIDPTLKTVNMARGSLGKWVVELQDKDISLVWHLGNEEHTSPFRHSPITLFVQCPEFVARQWYKHVIGGEYTFKDNAWNEISGRYIVYDQFWIPDEFHMQARIKKAGGTSEVHPQSDFLREHYISAQKVAIETYKMLISEGVAREEARTLLPLGVYTSFFWTTSQQALRHFVRLRTAKDAQIHIRKYAEVINTICEAHYGESWRAFQDGEQPIKVAGE